MTRTTACFTLMSRIGYVSEARIYLVYKLITWTKFRGRFPRSPNLEYKSQEQATGLSSSCEIFSEADLLVFVLIRYNALQMEIFYFKPSFLLYNQNHKYFYVFLYKFKA